MCLFIKGGHAYPVPPSLSSWRHCCAVSPLCLWWLVVVVRCMQGIWVSGGVGWLCEPWHIHDIDKDLSVYEKQLSYFHHTYYDKLFYAISLSIIIVNDYSHYYDSNGALSKNNIMFTSFHVKRLSPPLFSYQTIIDGSFPSFLFRLFLTSLWHIFSQHPFEYLVQMVIVF